MTYPGQAGASHLYARRIRSYGRSDRPGSRAFQDHPKKYRIDNGFGGADPSAVVDPAQRILAYTETTGHGVHVWVGEYTDLSQDLFRICEFECRDVWKEAIESGRYDESVSYAPDLENIWAPQLVHIKDRWYIYCAADLNCGFPRMHRTYVLESETNDPRGPYTIKGRLYDQENDFLHIDGTVFQAPDGGLYHLWSGIEHLEADTCHFDDIQSIFIAKMTNPWTIAGPRVKILTPTFTWERNVNEGPEVLVRDGKLVGLLFAANQCWGPHYCLGMALFDGGEVDDPSSWRKLPEPVFKSNMIEPGKGVVAPGHCTCLCTDQGNFLLYHHVKSIHENDLNRRVAAQEFFWGPANIPDFGVPVLAECKPGVTMQKKVGLKGGGHHRSLEDFGPAALKLIAAHCPGNKIVAEFLKSRGLEEIQPDLSSNSRKGKREKKAKPRGETRVRNSVTHVTVKPSVDELN